MSEPEILPAPVLDLGPKTKWERERQAFYRLLPDLLQTHRDKYVAIHEEKVVGVGDSFIDVASKADQQFGSSTPIYVGLVAVEARQVRISGPRFVRNDRPQ